MFYMNHVKSLQKVLMVWAGFILLALILFRQALPEGQVIQSMDYNYGLMAMYKAELPGAFFDGFWRAFPLLGKVGTLPLTLPFLLLSILPLEVYMDWIYAIHLLGASFFFLGFLRYRRLDWLPAIGGTLVALWLGNQLTLVHPGHLLKYGVVFCATATLFTLEKVFLTRSWRWALICGGFLGWMFMHQGDVALFFGLILGLYALFRLSEVPKQDLPTLGTRLSILLLVAGCMVWHSFDDQINTQVRDVEVLQEGTDQERWEFATQWSFPPSESMDLIAPGFWGWHSAHEQVPYHGVTGQSPRWNETQQGFPNLRLESVYLGILPFVLIGFSILGGREGRKERYFWLGCLILTLLLSFGKYAPFYALLHQLPFFSSIRNPNKFLQVFPLCAGVLVAWGLQSLNYQYLTQRLRGWTLSFFLLSILFGLGALFLHHTFPPPWDAFTEALSRNRKLAYLHVALIAGWSGVCLLLYRYKRWRVLAGFALLLALAADSILLARQYLKEDRIAFLQGNPLVEFLSRELGNQRVSILQPDPVHDYYMSHLFPAHHIACADIRVAPRLEKEVKDYLTAVGPRRLRMWREFGVKYVLADRSVFEALLKQTPALHRVLTEVWSYHLTQTENGDLRIVPGTVTMPGQLIVLEFEAPSDRIVLLGAARRTELQEALTAIETGSPALTEALIHSDRFEGFSFTEPAGTLQVIASSQHGVLLEATVQTPQAFLRLADRYDDRLRIRINHGPPLPLHQVDVLFAGYELP